MINFLALLILCLPTAWAKSVDVHDVIKDKDKYLKNEILINDFNSELGINSDRIYTGNDKHLFVLTYQFSLDYSDFFKIQAFESQYHYKVSNMHDTWIGLLLKRDVNKFSAISNNATDATRTPTDNDDYQLARADETKMTLLTAGIGVGYRFKLMLEFMKTEKTFEKIMVFFNYMTMNDEEYGFDYSGLGLTADYNLLIRSGKHFVYGLKLSYNTGVLKKKGFVSGESNQDRTRSIGWLSSGLIFGYNF